MAQRQNKKYLEAAGQYQFDTANQKTVGINNFGMAQDILSLRLQTITGALGTEKYRFEQEAQKQSHSETITLIIVAAAFATAILLILK